MNGASTLELPVPTVAEERDTIRAGGVVVALGTIMAVLGAFRLAGAALDYADAFRWSWSSGLIATRGWTQFLMATPPTSVLVAAWPMALGVALRRTRRRELIGPGALTFFVLAVGGLLAALADWGQDSGHTIAVGSLRLPRLPWGQLPASSMVIAAVGAAQLLAELATATFALSLARRPRVDREPNDSLDLPRRSLFGRAALYSSLAFLVLTVRLPAWTAYLELLNQSKWVREMILRDDLARVRGARRAPRALSDWVIRARPLLQEAEQDWAAGKYADSSDRYTRLAALLETIPTSTMDPVDRRLAAETYNNWAWLLATCPEASLRNPKDSVKYARRVVELDPNDYKGWNTLGVAHFRAGDWEEALNALYRSMELHDEGESFDWFFLAMIHQKLGHKERAREWYDKAAKYAQTYYPDDPEIYRFHVEAAEALDLSRPARPPAPAVPRLRSRPYGNTPFSGRRGRMEIRSRGRAGEAAIERPMIRRPSES